MTQPDYAVILLYLVGVFGIGIGFASRNKSASEMFAAGGQSPWWTSGLSAFMTMFSANTFVVWGGIAYRLGMVAVLINLMYGVSALLIGYFVAGRWKKIGVQTPAEFIKLRYGSAALHFFTWFMTVFKMLTTAGALYAMGRILVTLMPLADGHPLQDPTTGNMSIMWAIVILSTIVVLYTMIGGLWAVLMTDVLQFIVLNLAVLFVIPLAIAEVGGLDSAIDGLGTVSVDAAGHNMLSPLAGDYTLMFLAGWCTIHFFMIGAEWAFVQRFICVPDAKSARWCAYLFGVLYLVSPMLWLLPPMLYRLVDGIPDGLPPELFQYVPSSEHANYSPELIAAIQSGDTTNVPQGTIEQLRTVAVKFKAETGYINACTAVLPAGMVGLMFAAMFSATASMVSSQLNVFSGVLTNDIYRPLGRFGESQRHLLWVGRGFTVLLGAILIAIALGYQSMGGAEQVIIKSTEAVVVALLAPTVWGLFSRRVGVAAVWYTAGVGIVAGVTVRLGLAAGGFLTGFDALAAAAEWVQSNTKLAETISGVVLPIIALIAIEVSTKGVAGGYEKVEELALRAADRKRQADPTASRLPAFVVGWAIACCGIMMLALTLVNDSDQVVLVAFGLVMIAIATLVLCAAWRRSPGDLEEESHV